MNTFSSAPSPRRIRLVVAYDGTGFHGWQIQPGLETIQGRLEAAAAQIEGAPVEVCGSGRTDAGVHADAQVAALTLTNPIPVDNLRRALNRLLPPAIRVLETREAQQSFHPRFDALAKTYEYRLYRAEVCPPALWRYVHHHPYPLEFSAMREAAHGIEGTHDFGAFAASDAKDRAGHSKVRTIFSSRLEDRGAIWAYRVRGSGFLKHMVRNLMGALLEAGKGNLDSTAIASLLRPGASRIAAPSAPAKGLTLISVEY